MSVMAPYLSLAGGGTTSALSTPDLLQCSSRKLTNREPFVWRLRLSRFSAGTTPVRLTILSTRVPPPCYLNLMVEV